MREIVPGVLTWHAYSDRFGYDFNGYLVCRDDGNLCIDPVDPGDDGLAELARRGVAHVLITNRNHYRSAARVAAATGAPVSIHPADAAFVRAQGVTVTGELNHGRSVGPLLVVPAAGKSPGEIALYWPGKQLLIVGDVCIGNPPGRLSLLPDGVMDEPLLLRESLRHLAAEVDFDTLLVGDGECLPTGARSAMQRLVDTFDGSAPTPVSKPRA